MRLLRRLAAVAAGLTFVLIVLGALVRATSSGLACPDWPTCYGVWLPVPSHLAAVPDLGYAYWQVMLEWLHRLIAGVFLGPLILVLSVVAFRNRAEAPGIAPAGGLLLVLLLIQGGLGGVTVLDSNSPWSVALHLGTALLLFSTILFLLERSLPAVRGAPAPGLRPAAALTWVFALAAMMTAAMTAKSGASLACATWPTCNGALVPDLADAGIRLNVAHRALAAATGLAVMGLLAMVWWQPGAGHLARRLALAATLLVLGEIGLGGLIVALEVPVAAAVTHQALGVLTFATITLLMWRAVPLAERRRALGKRDGLALRGT